MRMRYRHLIRTARHLRGCIQTLTRCHLAWVGGFERAMDGDVAYLKRLRDVVREVSKDFEADPQTFNRPTDARKGNPSAKAACDFDMKFLRWDAKHVSLMRPNVRCPRKRHDPDPPRDPECDGSGTETGPPTNTLSRGSWSGRAAYGTSAQVSRSTVSRKARSCPAKALSPSLRLGATNAATGHDDLSQASDRFGQPALDAAYLCPSC